MRQLEKFKWIMFTCRIRGTPKTLFSPKIFIAFSSAEGFELYAASQNKLFIKWSSRN